MSETEPGCPFCNPLPGEIVLRNELAYVRRDRFPVAKGHVLAIPFRHVPSFFDTTPEERSALLDLIVQVKVLIDEEHHPDGYNIGVNVGSSAGQAVMHVHFHVIPRYRRDTKGHHGGIRWVIPRGSSTPGEELVRGHPGSVSSVQGMNRFIRFGIVIGTPGGLPPSGQPMVSCLFPWAPRTPPRGRGRPPRGPWCARWRV